jgi:hypothetical protein
MINIFIAVMACIGSFISGMLIAASICKISENNKIRR